MKWWVYSPARRLALPADMPRLDIGAVIGRRWVLELRRADWPKAWLLVPGPAAQPRYLPAYPFPGWDLMPDGWWFPHDPRPLIVTVRP